MPPPSSRMTKNRAQPTRYRPGKAEVEDLESDGSSEEEDDEEGAASVKAPPPKATSFPSQKKLGLDLSRAEQTISAPAAPAAKTASEDLDGFVTASESSSAEDAESGSSDAASDQESSEEEEDSSSDSEPAKPMLAPKFISKAKRTQITTSNPVSSAADDARLRQEKADAQLQAQIARDAAARAAGKKDWDDEEPENAVDDTDGIDPAAELAAWKLRELKRVRRDRLAIEEKEKLREEVERRRNLTAAEREEEDRAYIAAQKEEREGRGKMAYMQKYFHKGAFFGDAPEEQDEEVKKVLGRDLASARFEDEAGDKAVLPEYMRIRDMTRLGKKGRTKYKDLKNEDTGKWGADVGRKKRDFDGLDERFRPDDERKEREQTGANAVAVGERKRRDDAEDVGRGREDKRARYD